MAHHHAKRVLVPLATGCEELEAITITDLLARAGVEVVTAGLGKKVEIVKAARGAQLVPTTTMEQVVASNEHFDMIVCPGGLPGSNHLRDDPHVQHMLSSMARAGLFVAAICAGPRALVSCHLLDGKKYTCYPNSLDVSPKNAHYVETPVCVDGNIITSRGPGTAMDFALKLVELLVGKEKALSVENGLARAL